VFFALKPNINVGIPIKEKTYDDIFKEILETFSPPIIIAFLNSIFGHNMPLNSTIEAHRTEFNQGSRTTADYFLKITDPDGTVRYFHIEAQTTNDNSMAFRMVEYTFRFALAQARISGSKDEILIKLPNTTVVYLKDTENTPEKLDITVEAPDGQKLRYAISTVRIGDYTPKELVEQRKLPLFPFYMANYKGKDAERFSREWQEGLEMLKNLKKECDAMDEGNPLKLNNADYQKLIELSTIVIRKSKYPNREEIVRKMESMFEIVGVGVDWIEIKRQKEEYAAQAAARAEHMMAVAAAKRALSKGNSVEDAADIAGLPFAEVEALLVGA
jgi:hypothetical protein